MWPVIVRELQAEARHSFTYWLRVLGAGVLLLAAAYFVVASGLQINKGGLLFGRLHLMLLCSIWVLVPLVTADCISRERREGTLGLLFLTPLTARSIVFAKTLTHGLRAMTMCVAVLPVLALPFLMGGVSWQESVLSAETNFSSFCWAVAAGVLASSWTKAWLRSLVWALGFAVAFAVGFAFLNCFFLCFTFYPYAKSVGFTGTYMTMALSPSAALMLVTNVDEVWKSIFGRLPAAGSGVLFWAGAGVGTASLCALFLVIQIAARNVRHHWQEEPPSARQLWVERTFCTPVLWTGFFRRWMRWRLNHNPIGWLEQRTWSARLVMWSWMAIMISLLSVGVGEVAPWGNGFSRMEFGLSWLLAGSIAMTAAGSFRRERETGVLELLLVSPLRVGEIVSGRLRGIWGQFIPAVALLFISWLYLGSAFGRGGRSAIVPIVFFAVTFATLPVVGLYSSLRENNFLFAFGWTICAGILLPLALGGLTMLVLGMLTDNAWRSAARALYVIVAGGDFHFLLASFFQIILARMLVVRLEQNLSRRRFAF